MAEGLRSGDGDKTHGVHVVSLDGREHVAPLGVAAPHPEGLPPPGWVQYDCLQISYFQVKQYNSLIYSPFCFLI